MSRIDIRHARPVSASGHVGTHCRRSDAAKGGPYVAVATLGAAGSAVLTTPNHAECDGIELCSISCQKLVPEKLVPD